MTEDGRTPAYRWSERRRDQWRGRRAGRMRSPTYTDVCAMSERGHALTARYTDRLLWRSVWRMDGHYLAFEQRVAAHRANLAKLRVDVDAASADLDRRTAAIVTAQEPLTEVEVRPRNHIELAPGTEPVRLSRRNEMRDRRIASARGEQAAQVGVLDALNSRIVTAEEQIKNEFVLAQVAARQEAAHGALRVATYWENFVLAHPDGAHMAPHLRFVVQLLPLWVNAPPNADATELGRGPSRVTPIAQWLDRPIGPARPEHGDDSKSPEASGTEEDPR